MSASVKVVKGNSENDTKGEYTNKLGYIYLFLAFIFFVLFIAVLLVLILWSPNIASSTGTVNSVTTSFNAPTGKITLGEVEFTTSDGTVVNIPDAILFGDYSVGNKVTMLYKTDSPSDARQGIANYSTWWILFVLFLILFLFLIIFMV
jgi:uncharacterized integral membrane protein